MPLHIVAIDDDASIRNLYRDLFESEGYRVTLLGAPIPAARLLALAPDLVILDLLLGSVSGDGQTFLHEIKAHPVARSLPVLVCTAALDLLDRLRDDLETWACAMLAKPFDVDDAIAAVSACLAAPQARGAAS